jgi:hypothetical protein
MSEDFVNGDIPGPAVILVVILAIAVVSAAAPLAVNALAGFGWLGREVYGNAY